MAEPVSALPDSTRSVTELRPQPVPVVKNVVPESTEMGGADSETATSGITERVRNEFETRSREVENALSHAVTRVRRSFQFIVKERPVQLVVGIAAAAFVTGVALRIWRSRS